MTGPPRYGANRCTAHSTRTGDQCKRPAILGGNVCPTHGGSAPQVKRAAAARIASIVDLFFDRITASLGGLTKAEIAELKSDPQGIKALTDAVIKMSEHRELLEGRAIKRSEVTVNEQSELDREIAALLDAMADRSEAPVASQSADGEMASSRSAGATTP
jgi:hypothetical protein